ncbi:hypothetical protein BJV74DRAFT_839926 [Russula compacta]|nr:hypothetical protein BJV74DRAFT_839926 [Russula compacta]
MLFTRFKFTRFGLLPALLSKVLPAAATDAHDPCRIIAGQEFVDPAHAMACQKSFPFNETLRQNVLSVVSRVFDFYTFEDYYFDLPKLFHESSTDIRAHIKRINSTRYATDFDFNMDLEEFILQLNDGHTLWLSDCYRTFQNVLPAPVILLDNDVFIAPNSVQLVSQMGEGFTNYLAAKGFNWERLAGANVIEIDGLPARQYIDKVASTVSGNFLDHNVRVNSVVSGYRITGNTSSQRLGDLASRPSPKHTNLEFLLNPVNSTSDMPERVQVPFVAVLLGANFTDRSSYWANNCAATNTTNGADRRSPSGSPRGHARAAAIDHTAHSKTAVTHPIVPLPDLIPTNGSNGVIKSFVLPGNKTGAMFVGSFEGDFNQFQVDVEAAVRQFKASGVKNLLIDVTNNGGGYICLGLFLHQYLTGAQTIYPGFQSTNRASPLAQKILKAVIAQQLNSSITRYSGDNWLFLDNTVMPQSFDYNDPSAPFSIDHRKQPTSQRFKDLCPPPIVTMLETPPFDLNNVVIVGNGNCASTCAQFITLMFERHHVKTATFGGHMDRPIEFKGMAGSEVLEWPDLDSEIKTAGLKNHPLAPPDLLVSGNMRHNWRTAYSYFDETAPITFLSEQPRYRFPYTNETYDSPQHLWIFAEERLFGHKHK